MSVCACVERQRQRSTWVTSGSRATALKDVPPVDAMRASLLLVAFLSACVIALRNSLSALVPLAANCFCHIDPCDARELAVGGASEVLGYALQTPSVSKASLPLRSSAIMTESSISTPYLSSPLK